jgi:hypothetical protein
MLGFICLSLSFSKEYSELQSMRQGGERGMYSIYQKALNYNEVIVLLHRIKTWLPQLASS